MDLIVRYIPVLFIVEVQLIVELNDCFPLLWVSIEFGTSSDGLVASSLCWIIKQRTLPRNTNGDTVRLMTVLVGLFLPLCPVNLSCKLD